MSEERKLVPYDSVFRQTVKIPSEIVIEASGGEIKSIKFADCKNDANCLNEYISLCKALGSISFSDSVIA